VPCLRRICGVFLVACALTGIAFAQVVPASELLKRKVVTKIAPMYPEIAKHISLVGVVKLEVLVRADGTVKTAKVLGGNPVFLRAAEEAVLKWKFEPESEETKGVIEVSFAPH
jgi:TonB family protein